MKKCFLSDSPLCVTQGQFSVGCSAECQPPTEQFFKNCLDSIYIPLRGCLRHQAMNPAIPFRWGGRYYLKRRPPLILNLLIHFTPVKKAEKLFIQLLIKLEYGTRLVYCEVQYKRGASNWMVLKIAYIHLAFPSRGASGTRQ